jgi:hypothetical protein
MLNVFGPAAVRKIAKLPAYLWYLSSSLAIEHLFPWRLLLCASNLAYKYLFT